MSKKPNSAAKKQLSAKKDKGGNVDLFGDLSISGTRLASGKNGESGGARSRSAGTANSNTAPTGPVPRIPVIDAQDLLDSAMDTDIHPSPIAEEDGEVLAMSTSEGDFWFDSIIGHIEDLMMDDDFQSLQTTFFDKHCQEFDNSDENKLIYTDIHHAYVETIERFLEVKLRQRLDNFNMADFIREVEQRWHACESGSMSDDEKFALGLDGEVFEILQSFGDFLCFKEMMLDHKNSKQGNFPDFSSGLRVVNLNTPRP